MFCIAFSRKEFAPNFAQCYSAVVQQHCGHIASNNLLVFNSSLDEYRVADFFRSKFYYRLVIVYLNTSSYLLYCYSWVIIQHFSIVGPLIQNAFNVSLLA